MAAPQGLVCLMMTTAGCVKFLHQVPAGVEIDEVVVAEFLAVELRCAGNAAAAAIGVERGALVGIFAVAQVHRQRIRNAKRVRKGSRVRPA